MRFWEDMFLGDMLCRRTVGQKSQRSQTLADNWVPSGSFGRCRRERRRAVELLRIVDCVSESFLLVELSRIIQEFSVQDSTRRSAGGGVLKGYRLCRRPLRELVLVDFVLSVGIVSICKYLWVDR